MQAQQELVIDHAEPANASLPAMGASSALAATPVATPMRLLEIALQNNADLDRLERLMALQERWEENESRKAYVAAMAEFKRNAPIIEKDKHVRYVKRDNSVVEYDHPTLGHVCEVVIAALAEHGFSHNWKILQDRHGWIEVTCTITHAMGYSESVTIGAGKDDSGGKNHIQAVASTVSYLERYTLLAATGLASRKQIDDDGIGAGGYEASDTNTTSSKKSGNVPMPGSKKAAAQRSDTPPPTSPRTASASPTPPASAAPGLSQDEAPRITSGQLRIVRATLGRTKRDETELCAKLGVATLEELPMSRVNDALAFAEGK